MRPGKSKKPSALTSHVSETKLLKLIPKLRKLGLPNEFILDILFLARDDDKILAFMEAISKRPNDRDNILRELRDYMESSAGNHV